jgi:hypothetical protein
MIKRKKKIKKKDKMKRNGKCTESKKKTENKQKDSIKYATDESHSLRDGKFGPRKKYFCQFQ